MYSLFTKYLDPNGSGVNSADFKENGDYYFKFTCSFFILIVVFACLQEDQIYPTIASFIVSMLKKEGQRVYLTADIMGISLMLIYMFLLVKDPNHNFKINIPGLDVSFNPTAFVG